MSIVKRGAHGSDVIALQRALNHHGAHIAVDGVFGPATLRAVKAYQRKHKLTVDGQVGPQTWRSLGGRPPLPHPGHGPAATAIAWAQQQVNAHVTEHPAGSNRGKPVEDWQRAFGSYLVGLAWCGVFVGTALKHAGVPITARVASVAAIEDDARAGRNGFVKLVSYADARPGDVVCLFGRGVHTELIKAKASGGLDDLGGNTSFSTGGSESNGGACAERWRAYSDIHCIARPAYPSH